MQYDTAEDIREDWHGKPSDHDNVDKEYHLGSHTGDYLCTACGEEFSSIQQADQAREQTHEAAQGGSECPVSPEMPESQE